MKREDLIQHADLGHRYDEMFDADGAPRAQWTELAELIASESRGTAARRADQVRRLSAESGVNYNVHADPSGADRPWQLDPLPLLIDAADWQQIKTGVAQRARLLNTVLADLYGEQTLFASGQLPAELAYAHPNFLWPALGTQPAGGHWLNVYAADLARAPDGRWWVIADRTQAPSGLGYALENRDLIARIFPDEIGDMAVRPLGDFFTQFRDALIDDSADGLAVMLTSGPLKDGYFQHSYLARQLGMLLVEGNDLTVRDGMVFLKTLGGLKRVVTIVRRIDDALCDPLELRGDSALGVPGLMSVVRAGNVRVANALGSGVLESAAWMGFLPALAEPLIGESLLLPSVATWWCGETRALSDIQDNLDQLVIKPAFPTANFSALDGSELSPQQLDALRERISAQPDIHVVQERVRLSQTSAWTAERGGGWVPRTLTMRVYAIATSDGYRVMPGALAGVAATANADVVAMQRGGSSKDVWVLSSSDHDVSHIRESRPRIGARSEDESSRMIENLFWFGRYSERCEDKVRMLRATLTMSTDPAARRSGSWATAVALARQFGILRKEGEARLRAAVADADIPFGLANDVGNLARCAVQARSHLSAEQWATVSGLQQSFVDHHGNTTEARELLESSLLALAAMAGFTLEGMTRDEGWNLLMLGRRIERSVFLSDLISRLLLADRPPTAIELGWLLDIGDSTITHRARYRETPRLATVFDLMLNDISNPRGLPFLIIAIQRGFDRIEDDARPAWPPPAAALIAQTDPLLIERDDAEGKAARHQLGEQVKAVLDGTEAFADWLSLRYFVHADAQRPVLSA
ncbi:MAG: circularly permuted type 2 ATP-grasp protein [Dokdonella sp.]